MQNQLLAALFSTYPSLESFWTNNWIMILITALLSIVLAVLLLFKPTFALRDQFSARRKQPIWHEDALFMESFGKVYTDLNSDHSRQLMEDYHQQAPHVTHFCFLVHGYMGFSKVSVGRKVDLLWNLLLDETRSHVYWSLWLCHLSGAGPFVFRDSDAPAGRTAET